MTLTFIPLATVLYWLLPFRKKELLNFGISQIPLGRVSLHFLSQNCLFDQYPTSLANSFSYITWDASFAAVRSCVFSLPRAGERLNAIQHVACDYNKELEIWKVSYEIIWTNPDVIWLRAYPKQLVLSFLGEFSLAMESWPHLVQFPWFHQPYG